MTLLLIPVGPVVIAVVALLIAPLVGAYRIT